MKSSAAATRSSSTRSYAIGSYMLWDRVEGRIPYEVYGAPQLVGFEPATDGTSRVRNQQRRL